MLIFFLIVFTNDLAKRIRDKANGLICFLWVLALAVGLILV